jgi:transposase
MSKEEEPKEGRPSKLDPATRQTFLNQLQLGSYVETAAAFAGISKQTVYNWLRKGRRGEGQDYIEFLDAVEKAQAGDEARELATIAKAAQTHWQAAAWKLERKYPARWQPKVVVTVWSEQAAFLARLERRLPADVFEQVLLAGRLAEPGGDEADGASLEAPGGGSPVGSDAGPPGVDTEGQP